MDRMSGYELFLVNRFRPVVALNPPMDKRCAEPNPENPQEKCNNWYGPGHTGEHTWWFCESRYGDYPTLDCELKRGHSGDHEGHWA